MWVDMFQANMVLNAEWKSRVPNTIKRIVCCIPLLCQATATYTTFVFVGEVAHNLWMATVLLCFNHHRWNHRVHDIISSRHTSEICFWVYLIYFPDVSNRKFKVADNLFSLGIWDLLSAICKDHELGNKTVLRLCWHSREKNSGDNFAFQANAIHIMSTRVWRVLLK